MQKNNFGYTALMLVSTTEQAKLLLEAGAELPEKFNKRLSKEDIEEIKQFAQKLQQQRGQVVQQKMSQVKNMLKAKEDHGNTKQAPMSNAPKPFMYSSKLHNTYE